MQSFRKLVGWLFLVKWSFETVFQSISDRLPGRNQSLKGLNCVAHWK